ncbi:MAG: alpha/beta hydrolase [Labilithrix sp.]|nr:alpha/beta hydrolase [Labilithrix sp.]MCW5814996.1 alpha/beta hydrolase [Labilithrix sp.]
MTDESNDILPTWIEVSYPANRGVIGLRGSHAPLSWEHTTAPTRRIGDHHLFSVPMREGELVELKVVRDDHWAQGRNYVVHAGEHLRIEPYFDSPEPKFVRDVIVEHKGKSQRLDVLLPPSYDEQPKKRYPVLYVLDGQALWQHSTDPFGTWGMDGTLWFLYELGAIAELIVVGVHTSEYRLQNLTPVPDPHYGGGNAKEFLELMVDGVVEHVNRTFRTEADREDTGILGSSLGALFALYAAWTRPDVFGKAACLSSSFWWADRWAVRHVQSSPPPEPRPVFYLDSGAAPQPMEEDVRLVDGFHHTRSMLRALTQAGFDVGFDLHRLVFPGQAHHTASWAGRVALPLQLQFPVTLQPLDSVRWGTSHEENDLETVSSAKPESAHFKTGSYRTLAR